MSRTCQDHDKIRASFCPAIIDSSPPNIFRILPYFEQSTVQVYILAMDAQIAEWQKRAEAFKPLNLKQIEPSLQELDAHLTLRTHVVGYTLSDADTTVWQTLRGNRVAHAFIKQNLMPSLCRWFRYIEEAYPQSVVVVSQGKKEEGGKGGKEKNDDANYDIGLQDVGDGTGVVTRFPPEPS